MTLWRTILCPVDFSELSPACAAYARYLAERVGGRHALLLERAPQLRAGAGTP